MLPAEVTKVSIAAYGRLRDRYALLRAGGAAGFGVGPIVVARSPRTVGGRVAIPGARTTAALLLRLGVRLPAQLAVLAQRPVAADPLLEGRRVLADLVLQAAVPVDLLLSRRSFSAAMARSTP